ncbi:hypothetical protein FALCPG4_001832 [Fusarium falciforme]
MEGILRRANDQHSAGEPTTDPSSRYRPTDLLRAYTLGASPSGLPPMQGPGYGGPSRPSSAASSTSGERLPPLRAMDGRPPPVPGQGQVQEQDPRTGQWVSVQPRVPETGWATRDTHRR